MIGCEECERSLTRSPHHHSRSFLFLQGVMCSVSSRPYPLDSGQHKRRRVEELKEEERTEIVAFHQIQEGGHLKKLFNFAANSPPTNVTRRSSFSAAKKERGNESDVCYGSIFSSG